MAQLEEKLGALLSDEEGRQRFLQLAAMLSGSDASSSDQPTAESTQQAAPEPGTSASDNASSSAAGAGAIFEALPRLLQAMSGTGEGLDSKKVNLIRAISPYLTDARSQYIDRAIRMASVAKAARDTLGLLGRG